MKQKTMPVAGYRNHIGPGKILIGQTETLHAFSPFFEQQTWTIITDLEAMLEVVYAVGSKHETKPLRPTSVMSLLLSTIAQGLVPADGQLPSLAALAVLKEIEKTAGFGHCMN